MTPRCVLQHHWALFSFVYKFVGPFGGSVDFQADAFAAARALAEGRDPYLALLEEERQQQLLHEQKQKELQIQQRAQQRRTQAAHSVGITGGGFAVLGEDEAKKPVVQVDLKPASFILFKQPSFSFSSASAISSSGTPKSDSTETSTTTAAAIAAATATTAATATEIPTSPATGTAGAIITKVPAMLARQDVLPEAGVDADL